MKKIKHTTLLPMAAALIGLAACDSEDHATSPTEQEAVAQPIKISTRTTNEETDTEVPFDSFRLYMYDLTTNTKTEEHVFTKDENGAWLENGKLPVTTHLPAIVNATVCDATEQITFENFITNGILQAYAITGVIPTDQTDADKLAAAGKLMFAFSPLLDKDGILSLTFQHACSKLVFNVNKEKIEAAGGAGNLKNIKVKANNESIYVYNFYNEYNRGWMPGADTNDNGFDCFYNETDKTITAYIGYNEYKADDVLMTLDVDGFSRNVPIKNALEIVPGNVYTVNLDITPKNVTASVVKSEGDDIPGWNEDNETEL